jgi:3'-phosphoadenosine 5'-phosphosulfate (PAPS) 3'-phosphatase
MKRQSIFTPEILALSSKVRRGHYQRYLNDLISINEEEFMSASDVKRGLDSVHTGFQNDINEEDLTFWIDPLDGSSGLAQGHTEHLTCIIGVSVQKRPLLGVVHKPFSSTNSDGSTNTGPTSIGKTFVGLPESGLFTIESLNKPHSNNHHHGSSKLSLEHGPIAAYERPFPRNLHLDETHIRPRVCGSHNKN